LPVRSAPEPWQVLAVPVRRESRSAVRLIARTRLRSGGYGNVIERQTCGAEQLELRRDFSRDPPAKI
jgi:hypothetical protein